jgi:hypothetical protein
MRWNIELDPSKVRVILETIQNPERRCISVHVDHDDQVIMAPGSYTMADIVRRLKALIPQLGPDMCDPGIAAEIVAVTRDATAIAGIEG